MKWLKEIPLAWKIGTGGLTAALLFMGYMTSFQTKAEAADQWEQHLQYETCRTVAQMQAEIRVLTERLKFDSTLTPDQRVWLLQQIANIQAEINRMDPYGKC